MPTPSPDYLDLTLTYSERLLLATALERWCEVAEAVGDLPNMTRANRKLGIEAMHDLAQMMVDGQYDMVLRRRPADAPLAAYEDEDFPLRTCEQCGRPYRGPSLFCSLRCARAVSMPPADKE